MMAGGNRFQETPEYFVSVNATVDPQKCFSTGFYSVILKIPRFEFLNITKVVSVGNLSLEFRGDRSETTPRHFDHLHFPVALSVNYFDSGFSHTVHPSRICSGRMSIALK